MDALEHARQAWQRTQPQYAIDLWGDSPDSIEGHSRATGTPNLQRGEREMSSGGPRLSCPDTAGVLNARPGPETARGPHAPISPPGSSVEGAGGVLVRAVGNGGNPASSTTNQGSVRSETDAAVPRSREEVMNEQLANEPTKVGVEVETPQPKVETQTTEVEVSTPEGQPNVEVEVETPKEPEAK